VSALKEIGRYGSVGVEFILTLGVGFFGGRWLDRRFSTGGALAWAGLILGISGGFLMLVVTSKRIQAQMEKDDEEEARAEAARAALSKAETPEEERDK
jgi:Putative F0F1-ATPase subunit Ca2+/Mg2+ transporter